MLRIQGLAVIASLALGSVVVSAVPTVTFANHPAVVVKTVPTSGDVAVDPGLREIKITFSKEMRDGTWSFTTPGGKERFPEVVGEPRYDETKRTCTLSVKLEPGEEYVVGINWGRFQNFKDQLGQPAIGSLVVFKTAEAKVNQ